MKDNFGSKLGSFVAKLTIAVVTIVLSIAVMAVGACLVAAIIKAMITIGHWIVF